MKQHVVVIEDSRWLADQYQRQLRNAGYTCTVVHDGPVAIDTIDEHIPVAIILDVLLQSTTAFALLHELQSHDDLATIPVILISNIAERIPSLEMEKYGVKAILDKTTMHPNDLVTTIQDVTS